MPRGALTKESSRLVTVWVPQDLVPVIDAAVLSLDLDRSKFIRLAIREKAAALRIPIPAAPTRTR